MEFAKSLSGHDKNQYYLVLKEEEKTLLLVNGTTRSLEKSKRKNKRHVQVIKNLPTEIKEILKEEVSDLTIKRAIKEYEKLMKQEER